MIDLHIFDFTIWYYDEYFDEREINWSFSKLVIKNWFVLRLVGNELFDLFLSLIFNIFLGLFYIFVMLCGVLLIWLIM